MTDYPFFTSAHIPSARYPVRAEERNGNRTVIIGGLHQEVRLCEAILRKAVAALDAAQSAPLTIIEEAAE